MAGERLWKLVDTRLREAAYARGYSHGRRDAMEDGPVPVAALERALEALETVEQIASVEAASQVREPALREALRAIRKTAADARASDDEGAKTR